MFSCLRSNRSIHLLCSAPLLYAHFAMLPCMVYRIAHSLHSLSHGAVEIHECVHAVIAFNRKKHVFGRHREHTFFGQWPQRHGVAWGCLRLAWVLISHFSVIEYEVQDGTRKIVTKITCARALVQRISANGKFTQTGSGAQIKLWLVPRV